MNKNLEMVLKEIVAQDQEFAVKVCEAATAEEIKAYMEEKEIELTNEEAEAFFKELKNMENKKDVLDEEDLENVAGGWVGWAIAGGCLFLYGVYKEFKNGCKK